MRALHFIMGTTRKTTHTDGLESTISGRPDAQHGIKFRAMTAEPRPIIDNRAIPFKRNTVQKTGCGTRSVLCRLGICARPPAPMNWIWRR